MFSDLVDLRNKIPDTEYAKALYKSEIDIFDLNVREASEISDFYDLPLSFFIDICKAESPAEDMDTLNNHIQKKKNEQGIKDFVVKCIEDRLVEVYWYLGYYKYSYRYLDEIDIFAHTYGLREIEAYNKIRRSDRAMILGEDK